MAAGLMMVLLDQNLPSSELIETEKELVALHSIERLLKVRYYCHSLLN